MKRFTALFLFVLLFVGCARETAYTQPSSGCELTSWMMSMPAHTQRTPEIFPPQLRDTTISVNGTSHKISLPQGFTMSVFAAVPTARGLALSGDGVIYA